LTKSFEHSEVINRPIGEVFAFLSNFENNPRWEPGVLETHQLSEGPLGIGTLLSEKRQFMWRQVSSTYTVTEYELNEIFGLQTTSGPMHIKAQYAFEPIGDATRVTDTANFETHGLFRLMELFLGLTVRQQMSANFSKIKEILESPTNKK